MPLLFSGCILKKKLKSEIEVINKGQVTVIREIYEIPKAREIKGFDTLSDSGKHIGLHAAKPVKNRLKKLLKSIVKPTEKAPEIQLISREVSTTITDTAAKTNTESLSKEKQVPPTLLMIGLFFGGIIILTLWTLRSTR